MSLSLESFLDHGERQGPVERNVGFPDRDSGRPNVRTAPVGRRCRCPPSAREGSQWNSNGVPWREWSRPHDPKLFGRFLIADIVTTAVKCNSDIVTVQQGAFSSRLTPDLLEMGFSPHNDGLVRYCFSGCLDRHKAISAIAKLSPGSTHSNIETSQIWNLRRAAPRST